MELYAGIQILHKSFMMQAEICIEKGKRILRIWFSSNREKLLTFSGQKVINLSPSSWLVSSKTVMYWRLKVSLCGSWVGHSAAVIDLSSLVRELWWWAQVYFHSTVATPHMNLLCSSEAAKDRYWPSFTGLIIQFTCMLVSLLWWMLPSGC